MPMRFPGQYADIESGFSYNYYRDYDPSLGRYIQSDPTNLFGGINTYIFAELRPLSLIDPFGLFGVYGEALLRLVTPGTSLEAGGRVILGTEGQDLRMKGSIHASGTLLAGGASIGRGFTAGFFLDDVSDFERSVSINVDTPIGGLTVFLDKDGSFQGLGIGGPSVGFGVSAYGPGGPQVAWEGVAFDLLINPCEVLN